MPHWTLYCPTCRKSFTHSKLQYAALEHGVPLPPKPEFDGIEKLTCPTCKTAIFYESYQLRYVAD